ncbi:exo-beta-N-acetylmuramidase NamZ domain-containing protein [Paludisphaera rhizosphaerae]|uniref:exo-beta-N-acetylmuramidase NamZ domain-containing protein n=1 Tax=Paludisphaera rhizosphaerae TaxID=2711216 RepID=UPI001F0E2DCC|nr:exo-beta-N-acetylmuramidase NamZ domain-containing protein [Paludisphaera rhizosphaerae]
MNVEERFGRRLAAWIVFGVMGFAACGGVANAYQLSEPTVEAAAELGFDANRLERVGAAVKKAVDAGSIPGAVVLVGRNGGIAYAKAFGNRASEPAVEPMTLDTLFDMASLTKPIATATSVMALIEEGKIRPSDPIVKYFPELDNHGKGRITVEHLLRHRGGLIPDNSISDYKDGPDAAWKKIAELQPVARPGAKFIYSDVGFIILGKLVEKVSGKPLYVFAAERVFGPTGMTDAHFRPLAGDASKWPAVARIAPTEKEGDAFLRGVVHDPRSRALGGVAGHAGLFATAADLANYAQMLLYDGVAPNGDRVLSPLTVRLMTDPADTPSNERRGLGWDVATSYSSPRGELFGTTGFGHTGFTGTSIWIDPETQTYVILLTSRLHPKGGGSPISLRRDVATLTAAALADPPVYDATSNEPVTAATPPATVKCGIDVLAAHGFDALKGKRVGLVTNHTGRSADGRSTIDVLFAAPDVKLVKLFSPEHGLRGLLDHEKITSGVDEKTNLPVVSLYEGKKRKPQDEDLKDLDVLVYDIQDIGVRYYTYISTLGLVLEAAKANGKQVVVLDRPNPIGGVAFGGPVRDEGEGTFVAYHTIPIRHGMTVGEMAKLYNAERKIGAELTVIPCEGWTRDALYDQTGLLWVNPSPNMRSLTEALLYPGVGWLEGTNLATGRGTDTPFERVGAPWIKPIEWARSLMAMNLPGVAFTPVEFTPTERQYSGEKCGGVYIQITDRTAFEPIRLGLALALTLRRDYKEQWKPERMPTLLTSKATYDAILASKSIEEIEALWVQGLSDFESVRKQYLIYPE